MKFHFVAGCFIFLGAYGADLGAVAIVPKEWRMCDIEWYKIKSLPPLSEREYLKWLKKKPTDRHFATGGPRGAEDEADYYYFMARIPSVAGMLDTPSLDQKEEWLQKAANLGHKAANAALMRLWYLGPEDLDRLIEGRNPKPLKNPKATREEYLRAARAAAEAGDPEFATVMMDTAMNTNRHIHCQDADANSPEGESPDYNRDRCNSQSVTKPIEATMWAEIAARGGNPVAKQLLCRGVSLPVSGSKEDLDEKFPWCFATAHTACNFGDKFFQLSIYYKSGVHIRPNNEKANEYSNVKKVPLSEHRNIIFPYTSR